MAETTTIDVLQAADALWHRGMRAHGQLGLSSAQLAEHVHGLVEQGRVAVNALGQLHEDLYLAAACLAGCAHAVARFRAAHFEHVDAVLRYQRIDVTTRHDVVQAVMEQALCSDGNGPAIARYAGRAPLRRWLRSIAARIGSREARRDRPAPLSSSFVERVAASEPGPDVALLRDTYTPAYEQAVAEALDGLGARERDVLSRYYFEGTSIDELGRIYRVHRSTAARWVHRARQALLDATLTGLARRLGISRDEAVEIGTRLRSGLVVSVRRRLQTTAAS